MEYPNITIIFMPLPGYKRLAHIEKNPESDNKQ
jgi:hypothetical protein